jgi:predicted nucleotidyltransferase component of viral defense system
MDRRFYFEFLYPLQDEVLEVLRHLDTKLYLTGGTAASRGYLRHRFSDDLDLFANDAPDFSLWGGRVIDALSSSDRWHLEVLLREERFIRANLLLQDGSMKVELVNDVPAHFGELREHPVLGRLDSPENILANKLTALVDREEPKDLADVWGFCCRMELSVEDALVNAHSKAAGLFAADVARVLLSATEDDWKLVRWIEPPNVEDFLSGLERIGERLLLVE